MIAQRKIRLFVVILNFSFFIFNSGISSAQNDSTHLRISLLTCSPGEELYATFGHTAFRIVDSSNNSDIVYNYGTFNFDDEGFYIKFMRGKLLYYLNAERFDDFKSNYQAENRSITEQLLNLTPAQKINMQEKLRMNLLPQNKYYKYDFFFDNCTTRPRDIIVQVKAITTPLNKVMPLNTKFREAIHFYLDQNNQHWSKLGIDILLGAPCDAVMTQAQQQFLPNNLLRALDSSNMDSQYVVSEQLLYEAPAMNNEKPFFTPIIVFSILLGLIILLSFLKNNFAKNFMQGFDGMLFFFTGLAGILLVIMWTATDHQMCKNNFNLLWAIPTHFIFSFFVNSKKRWVKKYFAFTAILMVLLLLAWFFLPQQMNNALLPVVLLILFRCARRYFAKPVSPYPNKKIVLTNKL